MPENRQQNRTQSDVERPQQTHRETERSQQRGSTDVTPRDRGYDPFSMMFDLRREMDRLFDDFGFGGLAPWSLFGSRDIEPSGGTWAPRIETYEKEGKLHICADLPGLKKDDVKVNIENNLLTIEGERKDERKAEGGWSERSYGRFFRAITLPEGLNVDNAKATFENGVLDIALDAPKRMSPQRKQIEIGGR